MERSGEHKRIRVRGRSRSRSRSRNRGRGRGIGNDMNSNIRNTTPSPSSSSSSTSSSSPLSIYGLKNLAISSLLREALGLLMLIYGAVREGVVEGEILLLILLYRHIIIFFPHTISIYLSIYLYLEQGLLSLSLPPPLLFFPRLLLQTAPSPRRSHPFRLTCG